MKNVVKIIFKNFDPPIFNLRIKGINKNLQIIMFGLCLLLSSNTTSYSQRTIVGEEVKLSFESDHPYADSKSRGEIVWSNEIVSPNENASYVSVHFEKIQLSKNDRLILRSPDSQRVWEYTHDDNVRGAFWSIPIPGNKAIIEIASYNKLGNYGFSIDRIARGYTEKEMEENKDLKRPYLLPQSF